MRIKICGITCLEDAQAAVDFGADTLGINAYPNSPRYIDLVIASSFVRRLNPRPQIVGVFVKGFLENIDSELWDAVQLHGYEKELELPELAVPIYAAVSRKSINSFPNANLIVDESWGHGKTADWSALARVRRRFVLSGGLNPENVANAINACSPTGVDVCSGIESRPGVKEHEKMKLFIQRADDTLNQLEKTKVQQ